MAGRGREQAVGGGLLPALHALLVDAMPRNRRPVQALRGASLSQLPAPRSIHLISSTVSGCCRLDARSMPRSASFLGERLDLGCRHLPGYREVRDTAFLEWVY